MLQTKEKELLQLQNEMDIQLQLFKQYQEPYRSLLSEYLGLFEGKFMLVKRLHVEWQQSLKKQRIIEYDELKDIFLLKDLNSFVESLKSRHERGLEYQWDSKKDMNRNLTSWAEVPVNSKYKFPNTFSDSFLVSMDKLKQELKAIPKKKVVIEDELVRIRHESVHSYLKMSESPDYLSVSDLKRHKELQDKALNWLYNRGFIDLAKFTLPNGKKADIFAYNESQIIIFEIKASNNEFVADHQWTECLPYCHDFFFLTPDDLEISIDVNIESNKYGQFIETANGIRLIYPDERNIDRVNNEDELRFAAARFLSKRFIYGY